MSDSPNERRQVWITGIGLLTSLGEGSAATFDRLCDPAVAPRVDETRFAPYPVHPLVTVDYARQIPKKSDLRQMEGWQAIGVFAAGLALADAGIAGNSEILDRTDLVVAAGNGDRDCALDRKILETIGAEAASGAYLNQALSTGLRPTLYLGELSNLLAGNISIIHKATGSSRTLKGEEIAGVSALENAVRRISHCQGDVFLVGGALNAERDDLLLGYELAGNVWQQAYRPVWERDETCGGFVPGSAGAFLVLEAREHAEARGKSPYARLSGVVSDRSRRGTGEVISVLETLAETLGVAPGGRPLPVLSGASGGAPATGEERAFLEGSMEAGFVSAVRAYGSRLGHTVEAHAPLGVALAAMALHRGTLFPPCDTSALEKPFDGPFDRVLVTGVGHWRGEGLALIEKAT